MRSNVSVRNSVNVRRLGLAALIKELGAVGAIYFIRQFNVGYGDYTTEREALLDGIALTDIISSVREIDKQYAKTQSKKSNTRF